MINLLPPRGNTALKHEYFLRVSSVCCFLLAGVLIAATALTVPTYILISSQLKTVRASAGELAETSATFERSVNEIKAATALMTQLKVPEQELMYSEVIEEIQKNAMEGVSFSRFQAAHVNGVLTKILVQGSARTRNNLIDFRTALEASPMFDSATIPISDLARDADLPFEVTITIAETFTTTSTP